MGLLLCGHNDTSSQRHTYFGAIPGSNAHFHGTGPSGSTDPVSSAQPSSGTANSSGQFSFYLDTTKVGQEEVVDVSCGSNPVPYFGYYAVGYGDVYYNDHPTIWIKTGATAAHGSVYYNRYMQTAAAYDLYNATNDYFTSHPGVTQLCTNDMALPFGGKFDIEATAKTPKPWMSPHAVHDRGTAADVGGPGSGSCPLANQVVLNDFKTLCNANNGYPGASIIEGYPVINPTVFHVHCNFANPASYPH